MSLQETILGRAQMFFRRMAPGATVTGPTRLGHPGLGFDQSTIDSDVWMNLIGTEIGFADILKSNVSPPQFNEGSTVQTVVAFLTASENTNCPNLTAYESRMHERVAACLREQVAAITVEALDPEMVLPSDPTLQDALLERLNEALRKYLFRHVSRADLAGSLKEIENQIVAKAVIK